MSELQPHAPYINRAIWPSLLIALVCIALLIVGAVVGFWFPREPGQVFRSWLFAWIFWLGVSLGAMGIAMLHHLIGGSWGYLVRRFAELAAMCLPLMAVLFIPVIVGAVAIYPWMDKAQVAADAVLRHKHDHFLNWPFWTARSVVYLAVFSIMALLIQTRSLERSDVDAGPILARLHRVSAGGLVFYFFIMTAGSIDWIMSREPHWYSTVFGFIVCISQAVSGACFLILVLYFFSDYDPIKRILHPNYLNDIGNVLLTFVILWAYLSFAQFLVTWLGNNQDEITWYIQRTDGGWRWIGAALILFHFLVPFIILLQRPLKRKMGRLAAIAAFVFFMHIIDELYWVTPADPHSGVWTTGKWIYAEFLNVCAFGAVGGLWLTMFLWLLRDRPVLPVGDRVPVLPVDYGHGQQPAAGAVE
jgi:hypothetical protein